MSVPNMSVPETRVTDMKRTLIAAVFLASLMPGSAFAEGLPSYTAKEAWEGVKCNPGKTAGGAICALGLLFPPLLIITCSIGAVGGLSYDKWVNKSCAAPNAQKPPSNQQAERANE